MMKTRELFANSGEAPLIKFYSRHFCNENFTSEILDYIIEPMLLIPVKKLIRMIINFYYPFLS